MTGVAAMTAVVRAMIMVCGVLGATAMSHGSHLPMTAMVLMLVVAPVCFAMVVFVVCLHASLFLSSRIATWWPVGLW